MTPTAGYELSFSITFFIRFGVAACITTKLCMYKIRLFHSFLNSKKSDIVPKFITCVSTFYSYTNLRVGFVTGGTVVATRQDILYTTQLYLCTSIINRTKISTGKIENCLLEQSVGVQSFVSSRSLEHSPDVQVRLRLSFSTLFTVSCFQFDHRLYVPYSIKKKYLNFRQEL